MKPVDLSVTFGCLPPSNDNEWLNLNRFVEIFNATYGTNYRLESFPENEDRSNPQPEILLCDNEARMVIERKVLPWPQNFVRQHQLAHEFSERFFAKMLDEFSDDTYVFEIADSDIPDNKRKIIELVNDVTEHILKHRSLIRDTGGIICENEPIEWKFYRLPEPDREDYPEESGIVCRFMNPFGYYDKRQMPTAQAEIKAALSDLIAKSAPKFDKFADCLRVLIVEPYTNVLNVSPEMLRRITQNIKIPMNIDQIWLASWIELNDQLSVLDYQLIITRNNPQSMHLDGMLR